MHEVDMEALDKALGNLKAIENFDKWQLLELELRAIKFWDANYHADPIRNVNDICAFNARQARKKTILQEIGKKTDS